VAIRRIGEAFSEEFIMNPDDLIHAAPVVAKGAAALGAAIPFTAIVKRMLGPAADEVAEMWRDQVRVYRYGRQLKLLEKAERMATEAGFAPQPVPPKILFPLLEGASFEDDEDLHTMWAALLANASSPEYVALVRPATIKLLRDISPDEAVMLNFIYDHGQRKKEYSIELEVGRLYSELPKVVGEDEEMRIDRIETCVYTLKVAGLIVPQVVLFDKGDKPKVLWMTGWGKTFLNGCRPPKRKE
jgi:hypothetical protein